MSALGDFLIHPNTLSGIKIFMNSNSHAMLLCAQPGAGKETVIRVVASELGAKRQEQIFEVSAQESLGIDDIRAVRSRLRLRPFNEGVSIVLIPDAHRLTREAQNALLKLLEEPPVNTYFLLSAPGSEVLLPTIVSRTVCIALKSIPRKDTLEFLQKSGFDQSESENALLLGDGLIGSALSILNKQEGNISEVLPEAKKILSAPLLERLKAVDSLAKDKKRLVRLLDALERILYTGFRAANSQRKNSKAWAHKLEAVGYARECLKNNVSTKALLTRLMLFI